MPEAPEVETDRLHEAIHEEVEREGGALVKRIALTTALFAALAAIAALLAGSTVNEALLLKSEATTLQAQASDQWAYYQAKGVKAAVQEAMATSFQAAEKPVPPSVESARSRYTSEQADIQKKAQEFERQRDEKSADAEHLIHRHHSFANAVALLQVGIALGAIGALTRVKFAWIASVVLGAIGAAFFIWPFVG